MLYFPVYPRPLKDDRGTDPNTGNYNPAATENDGSCIDPQSRCQPVFLSDLATPIRETSGLITLNGSLWTINDSGNSPTPLRARQQLRKYHKPLSFETNH